MARKNNNYNYYGNGNRQAEIQYVPESPIWKVLSIILALILATAAVIGIFGSRKDGKFFAESDIAKFFNSWGKGNKTEEETYQLIVPQEMGVMVLSTRSAQNAPVAISGDLQADGKNTCTLTATLDPADAYYSSVKWTATEGGHIELTQDENDPLKVTVKLNGELFYTEQITVEVVSLETISATCNVDYLAYPDGVTANVTPATQYLKCDETYTVSGSFNYGTTAGTIHEYDCVITDVTLELTSETVSAIAFELGLASGWDYSWDGSEDTIALGATPYDMFCYRFATTADSFNRAFFKVCNGKNDVVKVRINCKFVYNGVTYTSVSGYSLIGIDSASYAIGLEGVNIGDIFFTD